MTKTQLRWRFKDLPTVNEVSQLVHDKIITAEDARDLLFNDGKNDKDSDKIKALEEQVEFLRDVISDLSRNRTVNIAQYAPPRYNWTLTGYTNTNALVGSAIGVTTTAGSTPLGTGNTIK